MCIHSRRLFSLIGALSLFIFSGSDVTASDADTWHDNTLKVSLDTTKEPWEKGTEKVFEVKLVNTSDEAFLIDIFGNLNEVYEGKRRDTYVLSCWSLIFENQRSLSGPQKGRYTLTKEQFVRLDPGHPYTRELFLEIQDIPPGSYTVRLAYVPRTASTLFSLPNGWEKQQGFTDPMWVGMAFSNELTINVIDPHP